MGELNKTKSLATVRAVIPEEIKVKALKVLEEQGITQSQVILQLFTYIADFNEIPFKDIKVVIKK